MSARVTLLDDGAKLTGKYGKQKGQSFHPDKEEYFVGPCIHGTKMADYIRQLCPEVELLIARLDDSRKVESGQRFTTASAYKALEWALAMDVDIVSMSWSFFRKGN